MISSSNQPTCTSVSLPRRKTVKNWSETAPNDHFVQFYRTDDYLIDCLASYVVVGLWKNENVVIIATPLHRMALEDRIRSKGIDVVSSVVSGRYLSLDAKEVLSKFMVNGRNDPESFASVVGGLVRHATAEASGLRAFGEMVAILWVDGNRTAIELEQLWNNLGREHSFSLFCAYPANLGTSKPNEPSLEHICSAHSCVISLTGEN